MRCAISPLRNSVRYFTGLGNSCKEKNAGWPHPCAFFLAQGWETTNLNERLFGLRLNNSHQDKRLGRHSSPRKGIFFALQLLVQYAHGAEVFEGLQGRFFVDLGERKANVDNGIVADLDLRHIVQANLLAYAAEVHPAHAKIALGENFFHFSWNC